MESLHIHDLTQVIEYHKRGGILLVHRILKVKEIQYELRYRLIYKSGTLKCDFQTISQVLIALEIVALAIGEI